MIGPQSLLKVCKGAAAWEIYVYQHLCLRALGMQKKYCGTIHPLKVNKHWEGKPTQGFESHIPQHQTFKLHFQVVQKSTVPRFKVNSLRSVFSSMIISSQPKNNPWKSIVYTGTRLTATQLPFSVIQQVLHSGLHGASTMEHSGEDGAKRRAARLAKT